VSGRDEVVPAAHRMIGVERMVRLVLLLGIGVSVSLMAAGVALLIVRGQPVPSRVTIASELLDGLVTLQGAAYLSLGIVVLIATPFVRVGGSIIVFARERDLRYVIITAAVLAVMCLSVLLAGD
jgi:uncharacterized membrane protein